MSRMSLAGQIEDIQLGKQIDISENCQKGLIKAWGNSKFHVNTNFNLFLNPLGLQFNEGLWFVKHCVKLFKCTMSSFINNNCQEVSSVIPILQARKLSCLALRNLSKAMNNKQENLCSKFSLCVSRSAMSDSLQPCGLQPDRLLCPLGFSKQEYWSGLPFPSPGDLPNPEIKPRSPALQADSLPSEDTGEAHMFSLADSKARLSLILQFITG